MTATTMPPPRIETLDIVRGVAILGILAMNIVDFAMPGQAYVNPAAYGAEGTADWVSWAVSFILIDGKMRGLFSFLFGASTLLVIERAEASGASPASVHYRRMGWLAVFGLLHFFLVWHGDILFGYACTGMLLYLFRNLQPRTLVRLGIMFVLLQFLIFAFFTAGVLRAFAPGAPPEAMAAVKDLVEGFAVPAADALRHTLDLYRGSYGAIVQHRFAEQAAEPLIGTLIFGPETLAYMLFGMAALKTGFLAGRAPDRRYARTAILCFAIGLPVYAALAFALFRAGFSVPALFAFWLALPVLIRPVMILGTAALIVLVTRGGGGLVERLAAAGRTAFTNYLGTSLVMTTLFFGYGGGLFGHLGRAELWLVVLPMWGLMLLWPKPWLERHLYGPFEWLWRSLARGSPQAMRRGAAAAPPVSAEA